MMGERAPHSEIPIGAISCTPCRLLRKSTLVEFSTQLELTELSTHFGWPLGRRSGTERIERSAESRAELLSVFAWNAT